MVRSWGVRILRINTVNDCLNYHLLSRVVSKSGLGFSFFQKCAEWSSHDPIDDPNPDYRFPPILWACAIGKSFCRSNVIQDSVFYNTRASIKWDIQGPLVQNIISFTSSLVVKILTVLVSTISNSQIFLLKTWVAFHIFSAKTLVYAMFNDQSFNDALTNDIISFEQWGHHNYFQ